MITNATGTLDYVNPAWCRIYGFTRDEAIGETPKLIHSGVQKQSFYDQMWKDILDPSKQHWKGELLNRAKDGRLIPVFLTITPRFQGGAIVGYMGIAVDLSVQKELESEVRRQDRLASIGLIASGLAHEIGTPLGVIRGRAELVSMNSQDESLRQSLKTIISQIDRVSKLIDSLLRISRQGEVQTNGRLDLVGLIDEVTAFLEGKMKRKKIQLIKKMKDGLTVISDAGRVQQIFINLLINAIHAIEEAIREESPRKHSIIIDAHRRGEFVEIQVQDSGCGIQPENLKNIFNAFFTTKNVGEGTGLGLSIVDKLVSELQGDIQVDSSPGVGTTFTLKLPAHR